MSFAAVRLGETAEPYETRSPVAGHENVLRDRNRSARGARSASHKTARRAAPSSTRLGSRERHSVCRAVEEGLEGTGDSSLIRSELSRSNDAVGGNAAERQRRRIGDIAMTLRAYSSSSGLYCSARQSSDERARKSLGGILGLLDVERHFGNMSRPVMTDIVLSQDLLGGSRVRGGMGGFARVFFKNLPMSPSDYRRAVRDLVRSSISLRRSPDLKARR